MFVLVAWTILGLLTIGILNVAKSLVRLSMRAAEQATVDVSPRPSRALTQPRDPRELVGFVKSDHSGGTAPWPSPLAHASQRSA